VLLVTESVILFGRDTAAAATHRRPALEADQPLLPTRPRPRGPGGRPRIDDRAALEGILFVLRIGCRWCDLPRNSGAAPDTTAWRRLRAWQDAGVWDRLHRIVLGELSEA